MIAVPTSVGYGLNLEGAAEERALVVLEALGDVAVPLAIEPADAGLDAEQVAHRLRRQDAEPLDLALGAEVAVGAGEVTTRGLGREDPRQQQPLLDVGRAQQVARLRELNGE